ncbi:RsmE family RNA methyltransferase [Lacticaseibacillus hulanensis]|uniref:RsmE family RNA methyltransferase n=1 Tax=Lacticaseibacillus hulanensis TaxID=2493111 RepID=UPI000FD7D003|nr:16S rRNA (uracil(1498)-N(3))-methyltransferase [Lacticaseibacillus hulanensis]
MQRYFTSEPLAVGKRVTLDKDIEHHAVTVLRMTEGDVFELASSGAAFRVQIVTGKPLTVEVLAPIERQVELPVRVTLVCGLSKAQKPEWITQKATELGATTIYFTGSQWATVRWQQDKVAKKLARLQQVAQSAAEQSHRDIVPTVRYLPKLTDATDLPGAARLVAYEESAKKGETAALIATLQQHPQSLVAVFGPEGGIAPEEVAALTEAGFVLAGLGPRILRTETAPLYLLSAISTFTELM